MKKIIAFLCIILTVVSLVCLSSCGKNSGLDVSTFTATMKNVDDYFYLKEVDGKHCYSNDEVSYTVTCDKKGYITSIFIECKNIPSRYLSSPSSIEAVLKENPMQWNGYERRLVGLYLRYFYVLSLLNEDYNSLKIDEITEMISWESKNNYGNWELYTEIESDHANIIANYTK